jgi:cell division protease FtsH
MVKSLGFVAYEEERSPFLGGPMPSGHREYSEETAREIDVAVREIVKTAHDKALHILTRKKDLLESWAQRLLAKESLAEAELAELRTSLRPA